MREKHACKTRKRATNEPKEQHKRGPKPKLILEPDSIIMSSTVQGNVIFDLTGNAKQVDSAKKRKNYDGTSDWTS